MPKIVDKEAKKQAILQAAMQVFAEKGVNNTKVAEIAARASIGKGTLYEYYPGKEAMFQDAMNLYIGGMEAEIRELIREIPDPREKLRRIGQGITQNIQSHLEIANIILDFWALGLRMDDSKEWKTAYQNFHFLINEILEEGVNQGIFRPVDTSGLASAIIGMMDGLVFQVIIFGKDFPIGKNATLAIDNFLRGLEK